MTEEQELMVHETHEEQEEIVEIEVVNPIIIDLGKTKSKSAKKLKRGKGPLMNEVVEVLEEVAEQLGEELEGKTLVPIVIVYEKKGKKGRKITLPF